MKVQEIMTKQVISVEAEESVAVAARMLARYNIGMMPVRSRAGQLCGVVTDRDLVTRCMASGLDPAKTAVKQVMTGQVTSIRPDVEVGVAAHLMGKCQVRRLPVTQNGELCGMVSLGDMARLEDTAMDAADALSDITENLSER